jgi:hypothetical protein
LAGVGQELRELVATASPEADDDPSLRMNVRSEAPQHLTASARRKERHHVPGTHDGVEAFRDAASRQVKFRQVVDDPARARMILHGGLDQHWINIDTDHDVPAAGQFGGDTTRATARIEDA